MYLQIIGKIFDKKASLDFSVMSWLTLNFRPEIDIRDMPNNFVNLHQGSLTGTVFELRLTDSDEYLTML